MDKGHWGVGMMVAPSHRYTEFRCRDECGAWVLKLKRQLGMIQSGMSDRDVLMWPYDRAVIPTVN